MPPKKILCLLDPYAGYNFQRDTSHLILWEFFQRGHEIYYADPSSLILEGGRVIAYVPQVQVLWASPYFSFGKKGRSPLDGFDLILMRKDPPVDSAYIYTTLFLSTVEAKVWVINHPSSLRELNEKLAILHFPEWIPKTLVSSDGREIDSFVKRVGGTAILKALDSYASKGVQRINRGDSKKVQAMTEGGRIPVLVQEFLPVERGEKRLFFLDGECRGALLRRPREGSFLTSPDHGGTYERTTLSGREEALCRDLAPFLREKGVFFAGVDLIDERLTEINVTSPGLLWEWNEVEAGHHEKEFVDRIEKRLR